MTFDNTPVAPDRTTVLLPVLMVVMVMVVVPVVVMVMDSVTRSFCDTCDVNGPLNPTLTGLRESNTRTGSVDTAVESTLPAAFTAARPPAPNVTATAAPIAAHR